MIESLIAFFMYFLTMQLGNIPPSRLIFSYGSWGHDYTETVLDGHGKVISRRSPRVVKPSFKATGFQAIFRSLQNTRRTFCVKLSNRLLCVVGDDSAVEPACSSYQVPVNIEATFGRETFMVMIRWNQLTF